MADLDNEKLLDLKDGVEGVAKAADKTDPAAQKAVAEAGKNMPADAFLAARKTLNNPAATTDAVEETVKEGAPTSPNAIIAVGLASALPMLLGSLFGGTEGAIAATEGAMSGAERGLDFQKKLTELGQLQQKPDSTQKMVLVDSTSGKPVMKSASGYVDLAGNPVDANNLVTKDVYAQMKLGERSTKTQEMAQKKLDLGTESLELRKTKTGVQQAQFRESMGERQMAETRGVVKNINSDTVVKKTNETILAAVNIQKLADLSATNPIAKNAVPRFLARASGEVGVMTDRDVAAFQGSEAIMSRLDQIKLQWQKGTLTPENQKYMKELAVAFERGARVNQKQRINELSKQYSGKDLSKQEITEKFEPEKSESAPAQTTQNPVDRKTAIEETKRKIAELKAKIAAKGSK